MKRTKLSKKLSLKRETVKQLESSAVGRARGGAEALFGSKFLCGSNRCDPFTKLAGTCTSCDGPMSCKVECITTEPL